MRDLRHVLLHTSLLVVCLGVHWIQGDADPLTKLVHSRELLDARQDGLNVSLLQDGLEVKSTQSNEDATVAACIIVKDERSELLEWIAHHQRLGIHKFYVNDDGSTQPLLEALMDQIATGVVHYRYWISGDIPGHGRQVDTYDRCLALHGHHHKWMAFFDTDEFLVIKDKAHHDSLPSFLESFEEYGGLVVNWKMYGSNNRLLPPPAGVSTLKYYTKCTEDAYVHNQHIKSIVQPKYTKGSSGEPHSFKYISGRHAVASNYAEVEGPYLMPPVVDRIVLNHYFSRTWTEVLRKIRRGSGDGSRKHWGFFVDFEKAAVHDCDPSPDS